MESIIWLFAIYCTANCPKDIRNPLTNEYFSALNADECIEKANQLINVKGVSGTWEIECKPFKRKVIVRPIQGN